MNILRWRQASAGIAVMAIGGWSEAALASGYGLREGATDWMANGYAGETAKAYDASTAFANPAGMVRLDQSELDASINGVFPDVRFSGNNTIDGVPIEGTTSGNHIQYAATLAQFGVWNFSPDLKFGVAVTNPFGQRTVYPTTFVGRYQALFSSITDFNVTLSAAYRVNEHFSIGVGPVIDYFEARLTQSLNLHPLPDGFADVSGQSFAPGYNIGLMYQFNPSTRVGIDYRSRIVRDSLTVGESISAPALQYTDPRLAAAIASQSTSAKAKVTLPDSVSIGFYHQINPAWAVMADFQWTDWSLLENLTISPDNGAPAAVLHESWHNTAFVAVGVSYQATDKLLLQGGLFYDESPVNDANRTSRIPDNNRYGFGIGYTYNIFKNIDIQGAYSHTFFPSGTIDQTFSPTSGTLRGTYTVALDNVSAGIRVRF